MPKARREPKLKQARKTAASNLGLVVNGGSEVGAADLGGSSDPNGPPLIFKKLDSDSVEDREEGCNALANIVLDTDEDDATVDKGETKKVLEMLVSFGVVPKLSARLCDSSLEVRAAAMGALRNLTLSTNPDQQQEYSAVLANSILAACGDAIMQVFGACSHAVDIINTINANNQPRIQLFHDQHSKKESTNENVKKEEEEIQMLEGINPDVIKSVTLYVNSIDLLEHAVAFLWNLTEVSEKATSIVTSSGALNALIPFLDLRTTAPLVKQTEGKASVNCVRLATTVAQFFNVITDVNETASNAFFNGRPDLLEVLRQITATTDELEIRSQIAGVIYNLRKPETENAIYEFVVPLLIDILNFQPYDIVTQIVSGLGQIQPPALSAGELTTEQTAALTQVHQSLDPFLSQFAAVQFSLELLTNIFTDGKDDEPASDDEKEQDDDDAVMADLIEAPSDSVLTSNLVPALQTLAPQVLDRVLGKTKVIPAGVQQASSLWRDCIKKYVNPLVHIQLRALNCLSNLILVTTMEVQAANVVWSILCEICGQVSASLLIENLEAVASASWGLLRKYKSQLVVGPSHLQGVYFMTTINLSEIIRMTAVGMLGVVGTFPQFQGDIPAIGAKLIQALSDSSAIVIAEALNSIFDLFAEPESNQVIASLNLMNILTSFLPNLKLKLRKEKKTIDREDWHRLDEARINLGRFIEYKRGQFP